jgi:hypothetical protein
VASKRLGLGIHLRFLGAVLWVHTVSDYYQLDGLLSPEDVALRERVRDVMETHVAPVMTKYWEKAEFPFEVVPKLASLMVAGGTVKVCTLNYLVQRMYLGLSFNIRHESAKEIIRPLKLFSSNLKQGLNGLQHSILAFKTAS